MLGYQLSFISLYHLLYCLRQWAGVANVLPTVVMDADMHTFAHNSLCSFVKGGMLQLCS